VKRQLNVEKRWQAAEGHADGFSQGVIWRLSRVFSQRNEASLDAEIFLRKFADYILSKE
jgi:hypothetical protein